MQVAETRYARSGDLRLAYQEFGAGPPLLIVPAVLSNVELMWEHEFVVRIIDLLEKHVNVVQFDKRGIGLSDRTDVAPTLEERIGDIVAVMDAVGWERASLLGVSEGGLMSQLFAATYPERVDKLILHNTVLPSRYYRRAAALAELDDLPISWFDQTRARFESLADGWPENSQEMVDWFMPDQSTNDGVRPLGRSAPAVVGEPARFSPTDRRHLRTRRGRCPGTDHRADPGDPRQGRPRVASGVWTDPR